MSANPRFSVKLDDTHNCQVWSRAVKKIGSSYPLQSSHARIHST